MAKYIIDVKDGETLYKAVIAPDGEPYITPAMGNVYTEPDTEKIRKEAYAKGFDDGRNECASREICMNQSYQHGYETGLDDAWDAARKIAHCALWGEYQTETGKPSVCAQDVLDHFSASEAIEKIRQYEQEHDSEIKVGDEVDDGDIGIVTRVFNNGFYVMWPDGTSGFHDRKGFRKTGRHFPEIAEVIKKMREQ